MNEDFVVRSHIKLMGITAPPEKFLSSEDWSYIASCLLHNEEKESNERDEWGNWEHHLTKSKFEVPYLDNFILQKAAAAGIERQSIWPGNKPFAFCLTHDLDVISENDPVQLNRRYRRLLKASKGINRISSLIYYIYTFLKSRNKTVAEDPLWHFEKWCDLEKSYDYSSTFYIFVADSDLHLWDCDLAMNDPVKFRGKKTALAGLVKALFEEGFEIGLHGSYLSFNNPSSFIKQKNILASVISHEVVTTRQHFLHYDIHTTPSVHEQAGIKTDSTLGYNRATGFRAGTCYPYYIADGVLEVPQIIMDGALFNENSYAFNESQAKDKIRSTMDAVESVGGCLVVNYHPNYLNRPAWWNTYEFILQELKRRNAYCTSMEKMYNLAKELCAE